MLHPVHGTPKLPSTKNEAPAVSRAQRRPRHRPPTTGAPPVGTQDPPSRVAIAISVRAGVRRKTAPQPSDLFRSSGYGPPIPLRIFFIFFLRAEVAGSPLAANRPTRDSCARARKTIGPPKLFFGLNKKPVKKY